MTAPASLPMCTYHEKVLVHHEIYISGHGLTMVLHVAMVVGAANEIRTIVEIT